MPCFFKRLVFCTVVLQTIKSELYLTVFPPHPCSCSFAESIKYLYHQQQQQFFLKNGCQSTLRIFCELNLFTTKF